MVLQDLHARARGAIGGDDDARTRAPAVVAVPACRAQLRCRGYQTTALEARTKTGGMLPDAAATRGASLLVPAAVLRRWRRATTRNRDCRTQDPGPDAHSCLLTLSLLQPLVARHRAAPRVATDLERAVAVAAGIVMQPMRGQQARGLTTGAFGCRRLHRYPTSDDARGPTITSGHLRGAVGAKAAAERVV